MLFGHFEAASHGAEARLLRDLDRPPGGRDAPAPATRRMLSDGALCARASPPSPSASTARWQPVIVRVLNQLPEWADALRAR